MYVGSGLDQHATNKKKGKTEGNRRGSSPRHNRGKGHGSFQPRHRMLQKIAKKTWVIYPTSHATKKKKWHGSYTRHAILKNKIIKVCHVPETVSPPRPSISKKVNKLVKSSQMYPTSHVPHINKANFFDKF